MTNSRLNELSIQTSLQFQIIFSDDRRLKKIVIHKVNNDTGELVLVDPHIMTDVLDDLMILDNQVFSLMNYKDIISNITDELFHDYRINHTIQVIQEGILVQNLFIT